MPAIPLVSYILGGWDLAISGDLILQGVLFARCAHYISLYIKDIQFLRVYVITLLIVTTLKSAQLLVILWLQNAVHFTDSAEAAGMVNTAWPAVYNIVFVALIAFYVQLFFCQRLWVTSRNIYIVVLVAALFLFGLVASFVAVATRGNPEMARSWVAIHLAIVFAGDLLLCANTAYFLLVGDLTYAPISATHLPASPETPEAGTAADSGHAERSRQADVSVRRARGALRADQPRLLAGGQHLRGRERLDDGLAHLILPKLYAISALWTLNSREGIRLARSSNANGQTTSSGEARSGGGRSGRRRTNNVELGALSGTRGVLGTIQVRTQVQTIQRGDDVFSKSPLDDVMTGSELEAERNSTGKEIIMAI